MGAFINHRNDMGFVDVTENYKGNVKMTYNTNKVLYKKKWSSSHEKMAIGIQ